jgi:hypothetical protein
MGSSRFYELTGIRPPGHSRPIAPVERRQKLTATLSYMNSSGEVAFGREVKIEQEFGWLQLPPELEGGDEFRVWVGFEVQTRDPELRNSTLVVATHPYSTDWFDWADFKPILNRSREERLRTLRAPGVRLSTMFRSRPELPTENLESRPGWLTARLSLPTRTKGLAITSRARFQTQDVWNVFESSVNGRYQRTRQSDLWCFGACRQFESCRDALRVSPQAIRLFERTEDGTLFNNRKRVGPSPFREIGAIAKALHPAVLDSSIIKALAGKSPKLDTIVAKGKPLLAALLMERIYEDTMYNLVKRVNEPEAGARVYLKNLETVAAAETPREGTFAEKIKIFENRFGKQKPPEVFRQKIQGWLTTGCVDDRIAACAALVGAHKTGSRIHGIFEPLLQSLANDPNEDPLARKAARTVLDLMQKDDPP